MIVIKVWSMLGDGVYLIKPLKRFVQLHKGEDIRLFDNGAGNKLVWDMIRAVLPNIPLVDTMPENARCVSASPTIAFGHCSNGYCQQLGIPYVGPYPEDGWIGPEEVTEKKYIGIAPFSVSGVTNRVISASQWQPTIERLSELGIVHAFSGGVDVFPGVPNFTAGSIKELVSFLRRCLMVVSVDTGILHVASTMGVPTIALWARAGCWAGFAPTWAPDTGFIKIGTPVLLKPGWLVTEIERFLMDFGKAGRRLFSSIPIHQFYCKAPWPKFARRTKDYLPLPLHISRFGGVRGVI